MAPFLGYLEERWRYLVNRKRKKNKERNHEIIQEPIILLDDTFCQFCSLRPAARNLSECCGFVVYTVAMIFQIPGKKI